MRDLATRWVLTSTSLYGLETSSEFPRREKAVATARLLHSINKTMKRLPCRAVVRDSWTGETIDIPAEPQR